jgi:hypothetical protein
VTCDNWPEAREQRVTVEMSGAIDVERRDEIAVVMLRNDYKRNVLDPAMLDALRLDRWSAPSSRPPFRGVRPTTEAVRRAALTFDVGCIPRRERSEWIAAHHFAEPLRNALQ